MQGESNPLSRPDAYYALKMGTGGEELTQGSQLSFMEMVKKVGLFDSFDSEELKVIMFLFHAKKVKKKEFLFHEAEECQAVYFICRGRVKTFRMDEEGREKIINLLGEGEMFPHIGLFGGGHYPATAMTVEEGLLYFIYVGDFLRLLEEKPTIAVKMLRVMEGKIKHLQEHLAGLLSRDISERVWHVLWGLARASGTPINRGMRLDMDVTHQDLAAMVGTTRETITRILGQYRKENKIEIDNGKLILLDK